MKCSFPILMRVCECVCVGGCAEGKPDGVGFKRGQEWRKEFQAANVGNNCLEEKRS